MKRKLSWPLTAIIFAGGLAWLTTSPSENLVRKDFDFICQAHEEMLDHLADEDPAQLAFDMSQKINDFIRSPGARAAFSTLSLAAPDQKYELYKQAAEEAGYANWVCEPMAQLFSRN